MILRKICILMALFLMPIIRADVDLPALVAKIEAFAAQLRDSGLELDDGSFKKDPKIADQLRLKASNLTQPNPSSQKKAVKDIMLYMDTIGRTFPVRDKVTFNALLAEVTSAWAFLNRQPHEMLQAKASEYFSRIFPKSTIEFFPKLSGDQLGNRALIVPQGVSKSGDNGFLYHIKTHRRGLKSETGSSTSAKPVNVTELFVYKFFQHLGIGPEVHFCWDNEMDFYIATKDVGCTEAPTVRAKTYSYGNLKEAPLLLGADPAAFEPSQESLVNPIVVQGLVFIDIISRIFGLTDLVTNDGNFYFICDDSGSISDFKIIDFDIGMIIHGTEFNGFLEGNGPYQFANSRDLIIRHFLAERCINARVKTAQEVFLPKVDDIITAIDRALQDVSQLQGTIPSLNIGYLEQYHQVVKANVHAFSEALRGYVFKE
ncbi:MAG: hypothetical protein LBF43_01495 [Puniceicoccales bacterium]|nr:hypothetical protein [Puniceicoccales bacterium]